MAKRMADTKPKRATRATAPRVSAASRPVEARMKCAGDWRERTLAEVRRLILEADPQITEERKWAKATNPSGVPVWSREGIVCTGETYKQVVKLTFVRGASLEDPRGLFNASLDGNTRRAIDIRAGEVLDADAFKRLVRAAVTANLQSKAAKSK